MNEHNVMAKREKRSALIGRLKSFTQGRLFDTNGILSRRADEFIEQIGVSDRVKMLTCCILVEDSLREILAANLPCSDNELFADRGLLSTIDSRCRLAYAMGLIDKDAKDDLDTIRQLRNAAAHALSDFSFEEPAIANVAMLIRATANAGLETVPLLEGKRASEPLIRCVASCLYYAVAFDANRLGPHPVTPTSTAWP